MPDSLDVQLDVQDVAHQYCHQYIFISNHQVLCVFLAENDKEIKPLVDSNVVPDLIIK